MMATKKCMDSICENFKKNTIKGNAKWRGFLLEILADLKKKMKTATPEDLKLIKAQYAVQTKLLKKMGSAAYLKKNLNLTMKTCRESYCNPGCKSTFYEAGKQLPAAYLKQSFLKNPKTRKIYEDLRKEKFGKRTNVLNDDFYENIKPGDIKKLKAVGAISGCMNGFAYGFDKMLKK